MSFSFLDFRRGSIYVLCFVLILDIFQTFSSWRSDNVITLDAITKNIAVCPPYFQNCLSYYFFDTIPISYGQNILYMILGGLVFLSLYFLYRKDFIKFFIFISIPLLYKFIYLYFLTYAVTGNYAVLGLFFGLILLLSSYKVFYLRVLVIIFYLCAAIIKVHDGYMSGDIFTSLSLGAPLIPPVFLPYTGVAFLAFCIIAPLGLVISKKASLKNIFLWSLTLFHIYSIGMVGFRYPVLLIPILWILFHYEQEEFHFQRKYFKDWVSLFVIFSMIIFQFGHFFIKGDARMTGEGYRYGYYMYDGNHQCVSTKKIYFNDGSTKELVWENKRALYACDPYEEWFKIKRWCNPAKVEKIEWTYDHSLNGHPYRRIINESNACSIVYKPFKHNIWIDEKGETVDRQVLKNSI